LEQDQKTIKPNTLLKGPLFKRFLYHNGYLLVIAAWLVTLSFIVDNYWSVNASVRGVQKKIAAHLHGQESDFEAFVADTAAVKQLATARCSAAQLKSYLQKNYYTFIYPAFEPWGRSVLFWNTKAVQPDSAIINNAGRQGFAKLANGYYVWQRRLVDNYLCVALMPVKWDYYVANNEITPNSFAAGEDIGQHYGISDTAGTAVVKGLDGGNLFFLYANEKPQQTFNAWPAVWMRLLAALCILLFLHLLANYLAQRHGALSAAVFLVATVVLLRTLSYYFPLPLNLRQFELFDPTIYGAGAVLRSLGDLLINAGCFVWMVLFVRQQVYEKEQPVLPRSMPMRMGLLLAGVTLLVVATLTGGHVVRSLVADSQISFDVVDFATLNGYSVAGFFALCCIASGYFLLTHLVLFFLRPLIAQKPVYLYLAVTVMSLVFLTLRLGNGYLGFEFCLLGWLLLFVWLLDKPVVALPGGKLASTRLIFWLLFLSVSVTAIIVFENISSERLKRQGYATNLGDKLNPNNEVMINTMLTDFNNLFLSRNFARFGDSADSRRLKDSLLRNNISRYHVKYDTKIFTFDPAERPLFNGDTITYNTLNAIITTPQARSTTIKDLYTYDVSFGQFNYIFHRAVTDTANTLLGHVFVVAHPKKKVDGLDAELFLSGYVKSLENSSVYYYALYKDSLLVDRHNDHNFPTRLQPGNMPQNEFELVSKKGYDELWYRAGSGKAVVIVRKKNFFIASITLFSYLFCAFLAVAAFFWLVNAFVRSRFNRQRWKEYWQLTIRNQVHATVIFVSVLSFIVIGVASVFFFKNRYEDNKREDLSRAMQLIEKEVRLPLNNMVALDDVVMIGDSLNRPRLDSIVLRMTEIHGVDINLYDLKGNLEIASNRSPYDMGIISRKIDPEAYYHLRQLQAAQYFKKETVAKLTFLSNYVPLNDERGVTYAYMNVPYFKSETELRQEISYFFVAIINLMAFIFLISGIVALFIANRVTRSFSFISDKMREVNLGKMNEAIVWKRNDEIGNLVNEYNKMVAKLDESAAVLAKSEREGAWREMARQVAHEIKNPLTPMKLSLQYLQKAINSNAPNVHELSANLSQTLVEQIDHLSQIAGEFSQFANIGNPKKEWFDLNEVLRQTVQLHVSDSLQLNWQFWQQPIVVHADRTHFNRLFTNLLQNAIQAVPESRLPVIGVRNYVAEGKVTIEVSDNGNGIPEDIQTQIFTPNFTTKNSGTGLGLAMCKGIVEQARGQIWFETIPDKGTVFYVALPLEERGNG
jgi:two-component system, NtrC family, nitrogen regulation sensor histidine kinase NtrY